MRKLRSFLLAMLCMALAVMCFTSCGEKKPAGSNGEVDPENDFGGRTFVYASWFEQAPERGSSPDADLTWEKIERLEKKYNCKFEYKVFPMEQYNDLFISSTLSGAPFADFITTHVMWFYPGLVAKNYLLDLESVGVFDFTAEKWNQEAIKQGTYKGKVYGMGKDNFGPQQGLFWNKTLFARDGLPDLYELQDSKQWTWEKFREIAIKATRATANDGHINQWGLDGGSDSFVASNGGYVVNIGDDGTPSFGLGTPNAIEALQFFQDLKTKDKVFYTPPEGAEWDAGLKNFANGGTAMYLGNYWNKYMLEESMNDEFGYVYFPMGPKATEYTTTLSGFNLITMSSAIKNPKEAALFWNGFTEPNEGKPIDDYETYYEENSLDRGTAKTIIDMIKYKRYTLNMAESFPDLMTQLGTMYGKISNGEMTAQSAVDTMKPVAESILKDATKDIK